MAPRSRPRRSRVRAVLAAVVLGAAAVLIVALSGGGQARILPAQSVASPVLHARVPPAHVAVIVMENEEYADVIGSSSTPFINRLAARAALATQMYAIRHPSLPNYLALTGGSTFGIDSDCTGCAVHADSLVTQLQAAGLSWRAYMEDIPHPCFHGGAAGNYAKKHDPFMYYTPVSSDPASCRNVVGLGRLGADERAGTLPRFIWITPNLCHDMHDCDTATGDRFLAGLVPGLLSRLGRGGLLFITWDEGSSDDGCCRLARGGHVATIVAGAGARPGARLRTAVDHLSLLQSVEDLFGLARLRGAGCACTPSLGALIRAR